MEPNDSINDQLNHLFREESGKMVAVLTKIFGTEHYDLAEDVVQEALISAMENWKFKGIPDNPRAWLYRVARNKAIDVIRKNKHTDNFDFSDPEHQLLTSEYTLGTTMDRFWEEDQIKDDLLGMMFACCQPEISPENQVAFILKSLCGFSTKEIAHAFRASEDTVTKRIYRTKEFFRKTKTKLVLPGPKEILRRSETVLATIYLLFNEGYHATQSDQVIRQELISQAMYLASVLIENKTTNLPQTNALLSLMCFHCARIESRMSLEGEILLLKDQDRSKWNVDLITTANYYLNLSARGNVISNYHLEAAIAYEHCTAKTYEATNWAAILAYYDQLLTISNDAISRLNRAVAIMELNGPEAVLKEVKTLGKDPSMENYRYYHTFLGDVYVQMDEITKAIKHYNQALSLTHSDAEKALIKKKMEVALKE